MLPRVWWENKLLQPLWRQLWQYLPKLKVIFLLKLCNEHHAGPLLSICSTNTWYEHSYNHHPSPFLHVCLAGFFSLWALVILVHPRRPVCRSALLKRLGLCLSSSCPSPCKAWLGIATSQALRDLVVRDAVAGVGGGTQVSATADAWPVWSLMLVQHAFETLLSELTFLFFA